MSSQVGNLEVGVSTNLASLYTGLQQAADRIGQFGDKVSKQMDAVGKSFDKLNGYLGAIGVSLGAAAFVGGIKSAIDYADKLNDLSKTTGIAVETLGGLGYAAKQSGVDLDTVAKGVQKLARQMADAAGGNAQLTDLFQRVGVATKDVTGALRPLDQVLGDVATKFQSYQDGPEKAALATELFGKAGASLIPLLDEGGAKLEELIAEYQKYAGVTTEVAQRSDQFNDTLEKVKLIQGALFRELASSLLPTLQALADIFVDAKTKGDGFKGVAEGINTAFKALSTAGLVLVQVFDHVGKTIGAMAAVVASVLQGEFARAAQISREAGKDISNGWAKTGENISKVWSASTADMAASSLRDIPKATAPFKQAAEDIQQSMRVIADAQKELNRAQDALAALFQTVDERTSPAMKKLIDLMGDPSFDKLPSKIKDAVQEILLEADGIDHTAQAFARLAKDAGDFAAQQAKDFSEWQEAVAKNAQNIDQLVQKIEDEAGALNLTDQERRRYLAGLQLERDLAAGLFQTYDDYVAALARVNVAYDKLDRAEMIRDQSAAWKDLFNSIADRGSRFISDFVQHGSSAFKNLWQDFKTWALEAFAKIAAQQIIVSITGAVGLTGAANAFAQGGSVLGGNGLLGGLNNLPTLIGLPSFTTAVSNLGTILPTFSASMEAGAGIFESASAAFAGTAASFATVGIPLLGLAIPLLSSLFGNKQHGPKEGGSATNIPGYGSFFPGEETSAGNSAAITILNATQTSYEKLLAAIGGKGVGGFTVGFDTDPKGSAGNRVSTGAFVNGQSVYQNRDVAAGTDDASLQAALKLEAERAVLAALKASDLPAGVAALFNTVDVASATEEQITSVEALAASFDGLGEKLQENLTAAFDGTQATADKLIAFAGAIHLFGLDLIGIGDNVIGLDASNITKFIDALGGAQAAFGQFEFLSKNFTVSADNLVQFGAQLDNEFAKLGYAVPQTHEAFLNLLHSIDLTSDAGRAAYASVLGLSQAFVTIHGTADEAQKRIIDFTDRFTTSAEKQASMQIALAQGFDALGLAIPKTHAEFLALYNSLTDSTDPTGAARNAILDLSTAFEALHGTADQAAQALDAAQKTFDEGFFTAAEQAARSIASYQDQIASASRELGESIPTSIGGFRSLVLSIDRTTDAGEAMYDRLILLAPAILELNKALGELQSTVIVSVGSVVQQAKALAGKLLDSFSNLAGESTGGFGEKLSVQIGLINDAIANTDRSQFTSGTAFTAYVGALKSSADTLTDELARFTVLSAQYDAERAEQLVSLQDWYNEQFHIFGGDTAFNKNIEALDALKVIFDEKWDAIVNGTDDAAKSLDEFIKKIRGLADATQGNAGQQAGIELALSSAKINTLQSQLSGLDPTSALAKAIQADIAKLQTYNAGLATQLAHFTIYTAQYGKEAANQLVELENWYADQQAALAGNNDALAILADIFHDKWQVIIDGLKGGVDGSIAELARLRQSIADYLKGLVISDISPLSPTEKLQQAQQAYLNELALASSGDTKALGDVTQFADAYLKLARDFYKSSQPFVDIFNQVTGDLGNVAGVQPNGQPLPTDPSVALAAALPTDSKLASSSDIASLEETVREYLEAVANSNTTAIQQQTDQTVHAQQNALADTATSVTK